MKLRIITVGKPKLDYAQRGWDEYLRRLKRYYSVQIIHLADKHAADAGKILETANGTYKVALVIQSQGLSSPELAQFLQKHELNGREVSFIIGGPEGLPQAVIETADYRWSLGPLTFPHDLAMVVTLEALYRASTINAGQPYHK